MTESQPNKKHGNNTTKKQRIAFLKEIFWLFFIAKTVKAITHK